MQKNGMQQAQELSKFVENGGEVGKILLSVDWQKTPIGPFENWPQSLKTALSICLGTKFPMFVWWGQELTVFYNDAYIPLAGPLKHPQFLGRKAKEQWAEIWENLSPLTDSVLQTGRATWAESMLLFVTRKGFLEETYFTFSYSPIRDESGAVGGIINPCQETTERILSERRLKILRELGRMEAKTEAEVGKMAARIFAENVYDIPFCSIYLNTPEGDSTNLVGSFGVEAQSHIAPQSMNLSNENEWLFKRINQTKQPEIIKDLRRLFVSDLPTTPFEEKPDWAYVLPIELATSSHPIGYIIFGVSPRLSFDHLYRGFLDLAAKQIATYFSNVRAFAEEKKRIESLVEIDRAKTVFFSNVSHEFRTPLTLLLGLTEEILSDHDDELTQINQERLSVIRRNALRLQKLVNSLLDFSRIEAGRMQVTYKKIDIAQFTAEIASSFESAMQRAGLKYEIDCTAVEVKVVLEKEPRLQ